MDEFVGEEDNRLVFELLGAITSSDDLGEYLLCEQCVHFTFILIIMVALICIC